MHIRAAFAWRPSSQQYETSARVLTYIANTQLSLSNSHPVEAICAFSAKTIVRARATYFRIVSRHKRREMLRTLSIARHAICAATTNRRTSRRPRRAFVVAFARDATSANHDYLNIIRIGCLGAQTQTAF